MEEFDAKKFPEFELNLYDEMITENIRNENAFGTYISAYPTGLREDENGNLVPYHAGFKIASPAKNRKISSIKLSALDILFIANAVTQDPRLMELATKIGTVELQRSVPGFTAKL